MCFCDRDKRKQGPHLANFWIVFDPEVDSRMPAVDERRAHGGTINLSVDQPQTGCEFLWIIGRPPDSLAFARSDRSGRDERRVFCLRLVCLSHLGRLSDLWKKDLVEFFSQFERLDNADLTPDDLTFAVDYHSCR